MSNPIRNHLFVIGINTYQSSKIKNLANALNDAQAVIDVLKDHYGFDNIVYLDNEKATRTNIIGQLKTYLNQLGKDEAVNDNLLLYFAGHGFYDKTYQLGYLVPFDGDIDAHDTLHNCIQNEELIKMLRPIKLHQLLVVSDSCFSGGLLLDSTRKIGTYDKNEDTPEFAKRLYEKKCRWIIASALLTHASDGGFYAQNSPFTKRFVRFLKQNELKHLTSKRLLLDLEESVPEGHTQTPVGGSWKYQDDGVDLGSAFVFTLMRRKDLQKRFEACQTIEEFEKFRHDFPKEESEDLFETALEHISWLKACADDDIDAYQAFYKAYPKSIFASAALKKIDEHEWEDAKDIALDAFLKYRKKHKKGLFLEQANTLIAYISQIEKQILPPQYFETEKVPIQAEKIIDLPKLILPPPPFDKDMVFIKGGTFLMGSPADEVDRAENETLHSVTLSDFFMLKHPVTVAQFERFIDATHYKTDADKGGGSNIWDGSSWITKKDINWRYDTAGKLQTNKAHPVIHVSWNDAEAYCKWLNKEGKVGFRLPTEAEWEYACRAGTSTPFNTGNNLTTDQANYNGNYPYNNNAKGKYVGTTTPISTYSPNAWGLYDMHGNVWEWCQDWYDADFYKNSPQNNPICLNNKSSYRVLRGGSWINRALHCRSAYRSSSTPDYRYSFIGVRLVFVP